MTAVRSDRRHGGSSEGSTRDGRGQDRAAKRQPGSRGSLLKIKHIIEESINVGVPHQVAYDQWTQYNDWSKIFKKESAERKEDRGRGGDTGRDRDGDGADRQVDVTAKIGPSQRQWQTEIMAQKPGHRIDWEAKGGFQAKGVVTFHRLSDRLTWLQVVIYYVPSGAVATTGNFLRMPRRRVRKDLKLFKNFIELRGTASGEGPGGVRGDGLRESVDGQLQQAQGSNRDQNSDREDSADEDGKR
jgi:hypothetical protein